MPSKKPYKQSSNLDHNIALGILVDPQDLDLLETYRFRNTKGYAQAHTNRKDVYLHRLVHSRMTGKPLDEYTRSDQVRHVDPNGLDDRRSNLFVKTGVVANHCDLNVPIYINNTSGIHGVSWDKQYKQWRVVLYYLGKQIHLGYYDNYDHAALVADHCRTARSEVTCSDIPMDHATMRQLLKAAAKTIQPLKETPDA
jgi:hypothetical protein